VLGVIFARDIALAGAPALTVIERADCRTVRAAGGGGSASAARADAAVGSIGGK
jgi:hypothetical protein